MKNPQWSRKIENGDKHPTEDQLLIWLQVQQHHSSAFCTRSFNLLTLHLLAGEYSQRYRCFLSHGTLSQNPYSPFIITAQLLSFLGCPGLHFSKPSGVPSSHFHGPPPARVSPINPSTPLAVPIIACPICLVSSAFSIFKLFAPCLAHVERKEVPRILSSGFLNIL